MNNSENFSSCKRNVLFESTQKNTFDIIIFGGGITGAGIALDGASRGLKVALFELDDFASGTSSRSTKLVHGGLRYLEKLQFKFVAQLGKERKILHDRISHNVIPTPVLLPIVKGGQLKKGLSFFGLQIYDLLAGVKKEHKTRWINKATLIKRYPFINANGLKGAYLYYEYKTNDGRLVIETLKKAVELGALAFNHCALQSFLKNNEKLAGAVIVDLLEQKEHRLHGKIIVNATGPWCETFMQEFDFPMPKNLYPTKGVHLVFSKERFPINEAFYFDTHDRRMVFAIPRNEHVYLGTTDTPYSDDLRTPTVTPDDINYLLKAVNLKFSDLALTTNDIISCWAGIRPLIQEPGKKPGEISRKEELFVSESGLISITGGKLTGFRLMAKQVVEKAIQQLNVPFVACKTQYINASGSNWSKPPTLPELIEFADAKFDEAKQSGISVSDFKTLFYRYGTNIDLITEKAYEYRSQIEDPEQHWIAAEIWYAVHFEMVATLSDFLIYRTEMVLFKPQWINKNLNTIAHLLAQQLCWSEERKNLELVKFNENWKSYQVD